jgi:hypothetical protein
MNDLATSGRMPDIAQCCVATLNLLGKDHDKTMREHFRDGKCVTCADTGRDAIPWAELFMKGREYVTD